MTATSDQRASIPSAAGREAATTPLVARLNARERRFLRLRANGMPMKAIAVEFGTGQSVPKGISRRLRDKLGVDSEIEAMRLVFGWRLP